MGAVYNMGTIYNEGRLYQYDVHSSCIGEKSLDNNQEFSDFFSELPEYVKSESAGLESLPGSMQATLPTSDWPDQFETPFYVHPQQLTLPLTSDTTSSSPIYQLIDSQREEHLTNKSLTLSRSPKAERYTAPSQSSSLNTINITKGKQVIRAPKLSSNLAEKLKKEFMKQKSLIKQLEEEKAALQSIVNGQQNTIGKLLEIINKQSS